MTILDKSKLIGSIMIINSFIDQYNYFEFNRVLLSRDCYQQSVNFLLSW